MDCKRCGAPLLQGVILCPECGARQRRRVNTVRCASCRKTIPLELTVCPHCGRNVRPAGPRLGLWLAALVAIVLLSLWGLGKLPIARVVEEVTAVRQQVAGLVQVLGPASTPTPAQPESVMTPTLLALITETPAPTEPPPTPTSIPEATPTPLAETAETPEPTAEETETASPDVATETPQAEAASSPTAQPTATLTPAPTATPSPAPSPTPTRTPTARPTASGTTTYRVQSGDSLSSIAARFGITWEELAAANGLNSRSVLRVGQELIIPIGGSLPPTATATPRPTATAAPPTPTPQPQLTAPALIIPEDRVRFDGGAGALIELTWQPVAGMQPGDEYQVTLRWIDDYGTPQQYLWRRTTTGSLVPSGLFAQARQPERQYTWYIEIVRVTTDGQGGERVIPLSPPSQLRIFYWH